ncbi:DASH complex subunit Dad2-domain-containing protein [Podospora australis]|uniref:DASH complex subunit DAD2 n=1 Tax=Podospora australis TaxID=1536484 RepID=A0AAN6WXR2_9PEZI|nr:DASH complex subunit Dad2-domain-containing protein [Podospora australis]
MSGFPTRPFPSHMRQQSFGPGAGSGGQSPALVARVNEKKAELENLKELRDLSAAVASKMEDLEQKLATLSDGTEAIALVFANWHNVLRAINMASAKLPKPAQGSTEDEDAPPLPQTLVRIPTEHAPTLQAHAEGAAEEESG